MIGLRSEANYPRHVMLLLFLTNFTAVSSSESLFTAQATHSPVMICSRSENSEPHLHNVIFCFHNLFCMNFKYFRKEAFVNCFLEQSSMIAEHD